MAMEYPQVQSVLEGAMDDTVESVSVMAMDALKELTDDAGLNKRMTEKRKYWQRKNKELLQAAKGKRAYSYFDGGSTKESPSSRLMSRLNQQRSDNHPPW